MINSRMCMFCGKDKLIEDFCWKNKAKGKRNLKCKKCVNDDSKRHYQLNKSTYLARTKKSNKFYNERNQLIVVNYLKSHPCVDCGNTNILVLDFDHMFDKKSNIANMARDCVSEELLLCEMGKCEIRCANCHRLKTAKLFNYYRWAADNP